MADALLAEIRPSRLDLRRDAETSLVALVCEPRALPQRGVVVVPPGYERRIHHYAVLSRYLTRLGYVTVRFDHANHVGLSDGDVYDLTMSSMALDIEAVLADAAARFPGLALSLVAPSLSARAAVRVLSQERGAKVERLVLLLPVIDVRKTVVVVAGSDVFRMVERGEAKEYRVSEHLVSRAFADDVVAAGFAGGAGTRDELSRIAADVTAVAAEIDDWVEVEDVIGAMDHASGSARRLVVIEGTSHGISKNPPALRAFVEAMIAGVGGPDAAPVEHLRFSELVDTIQIEREWAGAGYRGPGFGEEAR